MKHLPQLLVPAAIGGALFGVAIYLLAYRRNRQKKQWIKIGTLSNIWIYPIKSCKGISIPKAECQNLGLNNGRYFDRRFVITDREGKFVTAREKPKLVLIEAIMGRYEDDGRDTVITLIVPGMHPLRTDLGAVIAARKLVRIKMWQDSLIDAYDCGDEIANWLTTFLDASDNDDDAATAAGNRYRLVYHTPDLFNDRRLNGYEKFRGLFGKRKDLAAFSDLTPYMLMTEASMDDLNKRVPAGEQFSIRNFRPNFVVVGSKPYDEDNWANVRIGDQTLFTNVKGCTRCVLTTVNWATGQKHPKSQPLKTLASYRRSKKPEEKKYYGDSPLLGINLALDRIGAVTVGDPVYVQYK